MSPFWRKYSEDNAMLCAEAGSQSMARSQYGPRLNIEVKVGAERFPLYFYSEKTLLGWNSEALLTAALLPHLRSGENLHIGGEISAKTYARLPSLLDIYTKWDTELHRIEFEDAAPVPKTGYGQRRVGAFFSGGVDSFY